MTSRDQREVVNCACDRADLGAAVGAVAHRGKVTGERDTTSRRFQSRRTTPRRRDDGRCRPSRCRDRRANRHRRPRPPSPLLDCPATVRDRTGSYSAEDAGCRPARSSSPSVPRPRRACARRRSRRAPVPDRGKRRSPPVHGKPAASIQSFVVNGTPCSGPTGPSLQPVVERPSRSDRGLRSMPRRSWFVMHVPEPVEPAVTVSAALTSRRASPRLPGSLHRRRGHRDIMPDMHVATLDALRTGGAILQLV